MIGYVTLGTNDKQRAGTFYDGLLGLLNAKRTMENERFIMWAIAPDKPMLGVIKPFDGKPASAGNGTMVSIYAGTRALVDQLHKKAQELGGKDEGAPGPRGTSGMYFAYARDLDGNKLAFFAPGG